MNVKYEGESYKTKQQKQAKRQRLKLECLSNNKVPFASLTKPNDKTLCQSLLKAAKNWYYIPFLQCSMVRDEIPDIRYERKCRSISLPTEL